MSSKFLKLSDIYNKLPKTLLFLKISRFKDYKFQISKKFDLKSLVVLAPG
jgi:hypothetical protein